VPGIIPLYLHTGPWHATSALLLPRHACPHPYILTSPFYPSGCHTMAALTVPAFTVPAALPSHTQLSTTAGLFRTRLLAWACRSGVGRYLAQATNTDDTFLTQDGDHTRLFPSLPAHGRCTGLNVRRRCCRALGIRSVGGSTSPIQIHGRLSPCHLLPKRYVTTTHHARHATDFTHYTPGTPPSHTSSRRYLPQLPCLCWACLHHPQFLSRQLYCLYQFYWLGTLSSCGMWDRLPLIPSSMNMQPLFPHENCASIYAYWCRTRWTPPGRVRGSHHATLPHAPFHYTPRCGTWTGVPTA